MTLNKYYQYVTVALLGLLLKLLFFLKMEFPHEGKLISVHIIDFIIKGTLKNIKWRAGFCGQNYKECLFYWYELKVSIDIKYFSLKKRKKPKTN